MELKTFFRSKQYNTIVIKHNTQYLYKIKER